MASADITGTLETPAHRVQIRPASRWQGLGLRSLAEYRELIYFLTKREVQIKYKQSVLGVAWVVMQPLTIAFLFALFFGLVAKIPSDGVPYPVFAIVGIVPWQFTAQTVGLSAGSLVSDSNLISKVYFPRLVLPISRSLGLLLDLGISLLVMLGMIAVYQVHLSATVFLVPLFLLLGALTAIGPGTLFAAINVRYRDVTLMVPVLVQIWGFATPVIYPGSLVTGPLQYLWAVNPMVTVIDGIRWSFFGSPGPDLLSIAISTTTAVAILVFAVIYFRRTEQFFADVI
jgi:lipopolysaccharide transport system permease protein